MLNRLLAAFFVLCLLLAALVVLHPIAKTTIGPLAVSAENAWRPLTLAFLLGLILLYRDSRYLSGLSRLMARRDPTCIRLATALAVAAVSVAGAYGAFVAGGADSYGYISEADLWLSGSLHIAQPFTADLPWPDARWTFSPLGYRPAPLGESLVPVHAPGLPLLMATAKSVAGQCAVFAVVPLSAGLFVLGTYGVGRRLGRPMAGLAAALLVATSPTTIFLSLNPMSDLPSAAAWTWSLVFILGGTARNAAISGLAAALATLIRPNLMVLLPAFGVYALAEDIRASGLRPTGWARTFWFSLGAGLGLVALGIINNHLYGSPLDSGYGTLDYAVDHFAGNTLRYAGWLVATDTPVAFLGLAALAIPAAALWPTARERRLLWFLATLAATVWVPFLFYAEFEAWWYLRYALPAWPLMMIGVAAVAGALDRLGARVARVAAFGLIVGLALHGIHAAQHLDVFRVAAVEGKYRQAARMITERTPTGSVILSKQHSGSLRYYAGRLTARWDMIEPGWMGRVVEWLAAHGHRPYFLLEEDEVDLLRRQYGPTDEIARLDWNPVAVLRTTGATLSLYDPVDRRKDSTTPPLLLDEAPAEAFDPCPTPEPQAGF